MKRVTGLGGVFFKCKDPKRIREWYSRHLGIESEEYGAMFKWRDHDDPANEGYTVWAPFPNRTPYFGPGRKSYMLNYRVSNLVRLIAMLRKEHVTIVGGIETYDYGKFAWILDPEGNKIELFEPARAKPVKKRKR
jgi:catechol 2,3-dioxygenase-like lactoylglutathione lyase family enzyme